MSVRGSSLLYQLLADVHTLLSAGLESEQGDLFRQEKREEKAKRKEARVKDRAAAKEKVRQARKAAKLRRRDAAAAAV